MSTSEPRHAGRAVVTRTLAWALAAAAAALGGWLAVTGANPLWTLAAGLAVGVLVGVARRDGGGRR